MYANVCDQGIEYLRLVGAGLYDNQSHHSLQDVCCRTGREARALEQKLGIPVLRHFEKKPAGGAAVLRSILGEQHVKLHNPQTVLNKLRVLPQSL